MIKVIRRFQFCAGHRVYQHESKCANPHGHNYVMRATFVCNDGALDNLGRVIDFSVIKIILGDWIDQNWDHGFIYFDRDTDMKKALGLVPSWKVYRMDKNPTAENMAMHLIEDICPMLFKDLNVTCVSITLNETENCSAKVTL